MLKSLKKIDAFGKNILLVFAGSSLANFFNLLFQLLIAHKLTAVDFASFNSLLSVFTVLSAPLLTLQTAVAKYGSEFSACGQGHKFKSLFSGLFKKLSFVGFITFIAVSLVSLRLLGSLKINQRECAYILALLVSFSWIASLFAGAIQGLELFGWLAASSVISGALKLILGFSLIGLGYGISAALGSLLLAAFASLFIFYIPLKRYLDFTADNQDVKYGEVFSFFLPVAISSFCFALLTSLDMVLVKYFFSPQHSGFYSLAQMVGKIFLFLPGAVTIVMFPRTSGLKAKNMDTLSTLKSSLFYVALLCAAALLAYNLFPGAILKLLTGKVYPESILLGRLFAVSMSFLSLSFLLLAYFLSVRNSRFIYYLVAAALLQAGGIALFHRTLIHVQAVLCSVSLFLFSALMALAFGRRSK